VFLPIFSVLQCVSHIPRFSVSCHIPCPTLCISHYSLFSGFFPYSMSYSVHFFFSTFFTIFFLPKCHVLQRAFLILTFLSFSHHVPDHTVSISYFTRFSVFSPYSKYYSVHFSFSTFFNFSCHIPGPKLSISHFLRFSVFSP
jgi:hypothetical protein